MTDGGSKPPPAKRVAAGSHTRASAPAKKAAGTTKAASARVTAGTPVPREVLLRLSQTAERLRQDKPPITQLDPEGEARLEDLKQDIKLKKMYGFGALIGLGVELLIADAGFFYYLNANGGKIPTAAINAWLGAIVIQVVGVVTVITRHLFPGRRPAGKQGT